MDPLNPSSERPPIIEQIRADIRGVPYRPAKRKKRTEHVLPSPRDSHRLFTVEKGNRWLELARREPEAKMLLGELWHQGELCMLFADTNIGKSVLAVQIGESIACGQNLGPFICQAPPARVLYIDFELSQAQFGLRYSNGEQDHEFSDNFYRAQYNFIPDPPPDVDENELLIAAIEYKIQLVKATVLIIDNITCLRGGTENSAVALSLMKSLKALKTDHNLSILVLAHTPKRRNPTQPISADDLHGSKLLVNFADSAFAIGKSTAGADLCYLKQIKQRNTAQRYGADNVCLCRIQKPGAFLHFTFEGNSPEHHHLLTRSAAYRRQMAHKIAELSAAGHSQRAISDQLGIPPTTVNRLLNQCNVYTDADEEGFEDTPMTNDVMSNDQHGCADMQMCECADDEERYTNEGECADMQMRECADEGENANSPMTNDQNAPPTSVPIDDVQMATSSLNLNPAWDRKTSTIDTLLTPELLDQLLGKKERENSIIGKGSHRFKHPDTLMDMPRKNGDP
jgi:hypothetical protein